jgi:hypothetical protein
LRAIRKSQFAERKGLGSLQLERLHIYISQDSRYCNAQYVKKVSQQGKHDARKSLDKAYGTNFAKKSNRGAPH